MASLVLGELVFVQAQPAVNGVSHPTPNPEHLAILRQGVGIWNKWRADNPTIIPDLSGASLAKADLSDVNLGRDLHISPNDELSIDPSLRTNLSGSILIEADLSHADLFGVDLRGANLQGADLRKADLFCGLLSNANLNMAKLSNANLNCADLQNASLSGAILSPTRLSEVNLIGAKLNGADLSGSQLHSTKLNDAIINGANLRGTDLMDADLGSAVLSKADLTGAVLTGTKLAGADLSFSRLGDSVFDPESVPTARKLVGATGLRTVKLIARQLDTGVIAYDIGAMVELRESAKSTGLRDIERDLTCAVERIRNWNPNREWYARILSWIFFDLTCEYGAAPVRPLRLLICSMLVCSVLYGVVFFLFPTTNVFVEFLSRSKNTLISRKLSRLAQFKGPMVPSSVSSLKGLVKKSRLAWLSPAIDVYQRWAIKAMCISRVPRLALYFSLQSAFNIGYREFNIGNWLGRLQFRPYSLRAQGPVRSISGLQSLIGVYLLALWILCTFGRPFG